MTTIIETRLPENIERGAQGSASAWKTRVVTTASGTEYRNKNWSQARGRWNIAYSIKNKTDYSVVQAAHMACNGMTYGFLYKDWADFGASLQVIVADATAGQTTAQLVKTYTFGSASYIRTIYKPVSSSVSLYKNGSGTPMGGVSVNAVTGVVTFGALSLHDVVRATFEFDVAVRFDRDDLPSIVEDEDIIKVGAIDIVELKLDSSGQG